LEFGINKVLENSNANFGVNAKRRAEILKEATRLFCEGGYSGTRMTDIAAAIGVTKPVVYRYYKSKEELFEAWLEHELIAARNRLIDLIDDTGITALDRTQKLIDALLASLTSPLLMAPWRIALVESDRFPDTTKLLCGNFKDPVLSALDNMFEGAIASGEIKGTSAQNLTRLFLAPLASTAVLISIFSQAAFDGFSFEQLLKAHFDGFWRAWGK
jgi:AcrR family transcriptional regulator